MSGIPEPLANQLIDRLNVLTPSDRHSFELKHIKREALKLKQQDAVHAFVVLGMAACLEGNYSEMNDYHRKALAVAPNDFLANFNYAQSLNKSAYFADASKYYEKAFRLESSEPMVLGALINNEALAGNFSNAFEKVKRFENMRPDDSQRLVALITNAHQVLVEAGISDSELEQRHRIAREVLSDLEVMPVDSSFEYLEDDSVFLCFNYVVDAPPTDIAACKLELAERFVEAFEQARAEQVVYTYSVSPRANERVSE